MQETARRRTGARHLNREERPGAPLSMERVEDYLASLSTKGRVQGTIDGYRRGMKRLYRALPEGDKVIRPGTLRRWREELVAEGYSAAAVNQFIVAANGYLDYVHARELQVTDKLKVSREAQPELTRSEYLRLLSTARALGRERAYMLIKVFGNTDLPVHELSNLTVEALRAGSLSVEYNCSRELIRFPETIRRELLAYAQRQGIRTGPVFLTRAGTPMSRSNVTIGIQQLCTAAGLPREKGSPRCLRKLYQATRAGMERSIALLVEQAQNRLLEEEELSVGWESG